MRKVQPVVVLGVGAGVVYKWVVFLLLEEYALNDTCRLVEEPLEVVRFEDGVYFGVLQHSHCKAGVEITPTFLIVSRTT